MSTGARIGAFAAGLAVVFGGAVAAGGAVDPEPVVGKSPGGGDHGMKTMEQAPAAPAAAHGAGNGSHGDESRPVRGLAVADDGLRLVVNDPELRGGAAERLAFRIVDDRGRTVRDFDVEHEKRMHVIVVRRDLTGFQHLHPEMDARGTWKTPLRLDEAGSYRVYADFSHEGEARTLASDLRVDGSADLKPLPKPRSLAKSDGGYGVRLDAGRARAGKEAELRFAITRDGHAVHTEPYLGAGGHLVALREGDGAFLHVHPAEHGQEKAEAGAKHDDSIAFGATFPTEGRYRLFLQFKHEGRIQTVAFTQEVSR